MATTKSTAIRFTDEDAAIIAALQAKLGVLSQSDVIRMSLRALAAQHGVELKPKKPKKAGAR